MMNSNELIINYAQTPLFGNTFNDNYESKFIFLELLKCYRYLGLKTCQLPLKNDVQQYSLILIYSD